MWAYSFRSLGLIAFTVLSAALTLVDSEGVEGRSVYLVDVPLKNLSFVLR